LWKMKLRPYGKGMKMRTATTTMRRIVRIDEDKCNGCGQCVPSCAEGAIQIIDGKARLVADNLCDGLGNCLGKCPQDAITIEDRPAAEFDEDAVEAHKAGQEQPGGAGSATAAPCPTLAPAGLQHAPAGGCPGRMMRRLAPASASAAPAATAAAAAASQLGHWPIQLTLLPVQGPIWQDADVLIAADCVGFALPDFHERLLAGKTLVIACPKLDDVEPYVAKLTEIFTRNAIRSITVAHMEVPCCGGIVRAVKTALEASGRTDIRMTDITVGIDGTIQAVR